MICLPGFSSLETLTFWAGWFFVGEGADPMHCRVFSSALVSSTRYQYCAPPVTTKVVSRHGQVSCGGNHWSMAVMGTLFFLTTDRFKHVSEFQLMRLHKQVFKGDLGKVFLLLNKKHERQMLFLSLKDTQSAGVYPGVSIRGNAVPTVSSHEGLGQS